MQPGRPRILVATGVFFALACTPLPTDQESLDRVPSTASEVAPSCFPGCGDDDPAPTAPGIFLTSLYTSTTCGPNNPKGIGDTDRDGLSNMCEEKLAFEFRPELYFYQFDEVGREPHFAVRPLVPSTEEVRIAYMLSYYRDAGSTAWVCGLPGAHSSCHGHNGDSELIVLDVYYNEATRHWVLSRAYLSQHGELVPYTRGSGTHPTMLEYPVRQGGYPRVYVSQGKHANYPTRSACNNGGFFDTDTCVQVDKKERVRADFYLNIGSRAAHKASQDCMPSSNPDYQYYGSGRTECYWTSKAFRGWIPPWIGGASSGPYTTPLAAMGF